MVSLKFKKKHAGLPVFYSGSNECSLAPQFKWLDNTFKFKFEAFFRKEPKGRKGGAGWVSFTVFVLSDLFTSYSSYSSSFSACIKEPSLIFHIKNPPEGTNQPASPD
jgi:hypothetical protein